MDYNIHLHDRNTMMREQDKTINIHIITSTPLWLVVMRTPHPPHPSTEEVLGAIWLLGFVQIGPILTA